MLSKDLSAFKSMLWHYEGPLCPLSPANKTGRNSSPETKKNAEILISQHYFQVMYLCGYDC